jgi:hypothetical protein
MCPPRLPGGETKQKCNWGSNETQESAVPSHRRISRVRFSARVRDRTPEIETVILNRNPNPSVTLAAILTGTTNEPTRARVRLHDGERSWDVTSSDVLATEHTLTVLGMRPDST